MKAKSIVIAIGMMLVTSAWADAPNADAAAPADTSAPAATSAPIATEMPAADAAPTKFQKMDENLDKMHALVGQMKDAKDPAERQKLMKEYMTAQHENMMLARDAMGMGMGGSGMDMMGKKDCDRDGMGGRGEKDCDMDRMRGRGEKDCDRDGMHNRGKKDCDTNRMGGRGEKHCDRDGMHGRGGMGGMHDEATTARFESLEKRLDALQEMMKMMMQR